MKNKTLKKENISRVSITRVIKVLITLIKVLITLINVIKFHNILSRIYLISNLIISR